MLRFYQSMVLLPRLIFAIEYLHKLLLAELWPIRWLNLGLSYLRFSSRLWKIRTLWRVSEAGGRAEYKFSFLLGCGLPSLLAAGWLNPLNLLHPLHFLELLKFNNCHLFLFFCLFFNGDLCRRESVGFGPAYFILDTFLLNIYFTHFPTVRRR